MDADLASLVLGRRVPPRELRRARLVGWRRIAARGVAYPILARRADAAVDGLVLDQVTLIERDRLAAYEGEGYSLRRGVAVLAGRRARVLFFAPRSGAWSPLRSPWSLARWRRRDKRAALRALTPDRGRPGARIKTSQIQVLPNVINSTNFWARAPTFFLKELPIRGLAWAATGGDRKSS